VLVSAVVFCEHDTARIAAAKKQDFKYLTGQLPAASVSPQAAVLSVQS
jgi:hypothetical protein